MRGRWTTSQTSPRPDAPSRSCRPSTSSPRGSLADIVDHSIDTGATVVARDTIVAEPRVSSAATTAPPHRQRAQRLVPVRRPRRQLHRPLPPWQNPGVESYGGAHGATSARHRAVRPPWKPKSSSPTGGPSPNTYRPLGPRHARPRPVRPMHPNQPTAPIAGGPITGSNHQFDHPGLRVLSALPYAIDVANVRTRLVTLAGGLALILIPAVPYADTYFLSPGAGASFAFATVPIMAITAAAGLVALDDWLLTRRARPPAGHEEGPGGAGRGSAC